MGFKTLAIQQRSSEVWSLLGRSRRVVEVRGRAGQGAEEAGGSVPNTIEQAQTRTRVIGRKLRDVEVLPADAAKTILMLGDDTGEALEAANGEEQPAS